MVGSDQRFTFTFTRRQLSSIVTAMNMAAGVLGKGVQLPSGFDTAAIVVTEFNRLLQFETNVKEWEIEFGQQQIVELMAMVGAVINVLNGDPSIFEFECSSDVMKQHLGNFREVHETMHYGVLAQLPGAMQA